MIVDLKRPSNENMGLSAQFTALPQAFLQVYSRELLDWAASLQSHGPFFDLDLWNPPGATTLSPGWQGRVRLRCDALADTQTKRVVLTIQPDGEEDVARVRKHVEELPAIIAAHRARAEANRGTPRGQIAAQFLDIPEYFVLRYGHELRAWGQNLSKIGLTKTIVLREGNLSDLSPDPEIGAVLLGVKLTATIDRLKGDELRLTIKPATEMDRRTIAKHCEKMEGVGIRPFANLVEPARPGMPAFPDIIGAAKPPEDGGV